MIEKLTLTNFRNHKTLRLAADGKFVVLTGMNGAGKTNAIEAVSMLSGTRGLRHAEARDLARFGESDYAVAAALKDGTELSVYWRESFGHRRAKINSESAPLSELPKHIGVVWLTPLEDLLFIGTPAARRSFLDNLVSGFDDRHLGRVQRLSKLLSERAYALKTNPDPEWLDQIESNIVSAASAVADARVRYAGELNHFFDGGEMAISGILEQRIIDGEKAGDFEDFYGKYLAENRFLTDGKMVVDGAHRTDFSVRNLALSLAADKTSAGQQKLLLNKLVIANARLLLAKNPAKPLLILLDEADGHLDENARRELFRELGETNAQVWITGTDADKFAGIPNSIQLKIEN